MVSHFTLRAEWNQIYLEDAACDVAAAANAEFWNEAAMRDGMANARTMISVGTARAGDVVVSVAVREVEPDAEIKHWDHVVDAAITIPSGRLRVRGGAESPEDADVIHVAPGVYKVRAFYGNLDVESVDEETGDDFYNIVLWPGAWRDRKVVRRYER